jgi:hypothetical protein
LFGNEKAAMPRSVIGEANDFEFVNRFPR